MSKRDLESECWSAHDSAKHGEDLPNRLKALDLLVKIRLAGEKVKGEEMARKGEDDLGSVHAEINGPK